jgi:hypothetical protein
MSGSRVAEQSAEPGQEEAAPSAVSEAAALGPIAPARSAALRAEMLSRLPSNAARRDYVRAMGAAYGNRETAQVVARARAEKQSVARLIDAATVEKIAKKVPGNTMEANHLAWELIHLFVPEKGFSLSGSRYEATQVGFRLDGTMLVIGDDVVARVAKGETAAVGQELIATLNALPDRFKQLTAGGVSVKDAPRNIAIPRILQEGAETAWSKSLPGTGSQEQGGIIVETAAGGYGFTAGPAGTSGTFPVNRGDVKAGEKLLGIFHTHPYSAAEGGHTDVPFSGTDLGLMALQLEKISVVRSGDGWFAVATSKEFEALVAAATSKQALFQEIKTKWTAAFTAASGNTKERALAVTPAICLQYKLLYYAGHGGTLAMPGDMAKAYATP